MTTTVTLTGTGVPHAVPGRAGAGVLVRHGEVSLQFDAGRATVLRMIEAGVSPTDLTALFVTHYHSDHVVDLVDVVITRWVQYLLHPTGPLPIVVPEGHALDFVQRMMDPYDADIHVRREHTDNVEMKLKIHSFRPLNEPAEVWRNEDGGVRVDAVAVHHEPVEGAVAYRVTTPDGVVVISGDTRVCDEVFSMARGADLVVHESCRKRSMLQAMRGTAFEQIFDYHSDSVTLGEFAQRYGVAHMLLTHLIPSPSTPEQAASFEDDLREGGYTGKVTVGEDLSTIILG